MFVYGAKCYKKSFKEILQFKHKKMLKTDIIVLLLKKINIL